MAAATLAHVPARRTRPRRTDRRRVLLYAVLVIAACATLLPFAWMLSASVRTQGDLTGHPTTLWPSHITWANYTSIWTQIPLRRQFINTAVFAISVAALSVAIDSMAGYALARFEFPGRTAVFVVVIMTMMLPIQVTLIPIFRLLVDLHWINTYQGLIVPRAADAFGIFLMRQFFLALPKDLEEAARIDGASEMRIFLRVMLPLAVPALLTLGLFNMLANWNDLLWPLIVTTDSNMQTLPAGLALFKGQHVTQYGLLMAGAVIALVPMLIAFLFVQRRFIEGIATTGIK
ncbi:MAG: multiple sugar transport system permease protein [Frankiales bacterium]|jgi:multiple sugar transport system permease protein|nr:multiple sugar transport system permease protein [Frankiales bacterium]MDX6255122.1 multiple sugar transport system permease protein [Frankiales bacterium]